jgi:hypothetical protein
MFTKKNFRVGIIQNKIKIIKYLIHKLSNIKIKKIYNIRVDRFLKILTRDIHFLYLFNPLSSVIFILFDFNKLSQVR